MGASSNGARQQAYQDFNVNALAETTIAHPEPSRNFNMQLNSIYTVSIFACGIL